MATLALGLLRPNRASSILWRLYRWPRNPRDRPGCSCERPSPAPNQMAGAVDAKRREAARR
eukprot:11180261-Lingulodinium_polyedra.AAC.1